MEDENGSSKRKHIRDVIKMKKRHFNDENDIIEDANNWMNDEDKKMLGINITNNIENANKKNMSMGKIERTD